MKLRILSLVIFVLLGTSCLWAQNTSQFSKKELFSRARDALKVALENGNRERAGEALEYLRTNASAGAPLSYFEEYLISMELGRYEEGILLYADLRHSVMDNEYKPEREERVEEYDPLSKYLFRDLNPFTQAKADSLYAIVEKSDVKQEYKELYRVMLYAELALAKNLLTYGGYRLSWDTVKDTACAAVLLDLAGRYVDTFPMSSYTFFFKEKLIPFVKEIMQPLEDFRNDPFSQKYYTGGIGAHVYGWVGFLSGEGADYLNDYMGTPFMTDLTVRIKRFSLNAFLSLGMVTEPPDYRWQTCDDESIGLTLGFNVFDTRYLRVEPFIGYGATYYCCAEASPDDFILGSNVDFRFFATRPSRIGGPSLALDLRFKYMMQMEMFQSNEVNDREELFLMRHTFALGLGIELW